LVELLVVLAITSVVLGAILEIFSSSNRSYAVQEQVAAMQQNLRVSKMFLARDIRMAGAGLKGYSDPNGNRVYGIDFINNVDNDINGNPASDQIVINYIGFDDEGCGTNPDPFGDGTPLCDTLPSLSLKADMPPSSSEAEVEEDFSVAPDDVWDDDCACNDANGNPVKFTQPTPGYMALITSPDGSMQNTFFVTGIQQVGGDDKLQNAPFNGFTNKVANTFPAGSTITFFNSNSITNVTYSIVNEVLMRNGDALAEGIEDLQFAVGLDTNNDGSVDTTVVTPGTGNSLTNAEKDQVRWVRIGLIGKTLKAGASYINSTHPGLEDSPLTGTTGRFTRKPLQVTVKTRNLGL
jgi:type II secretory pathway pseudopilin PulG